MGFSDILREAVEAFRWVAVWDHISEQQEMSMSGHSNSFTIWYSTPLYKDPSPLGIVNGSHLCHFLFSAFSITTTAGLVQTWNFLSILFSLFPVSLLTF